VYDACWCGRAVNATDHAGEFYMANDIWEGRRIRLRAVEPADADAHWHWNQDGETSRRLDRIYFPQSREATRRWAERAATEQPGDAFHFEIETRAGELVGSLGTHDCDPRNGTFALGVAVREEHRRRGYASDAIRLVLRYYFEELRYQKVTVHVYGFNEASIHLFEQLGFQHEGRLRRMIFTEGRFFDLVVLGMTADEFTARSSP
jgi:RimJ/RimL family protein N-acetyltransferase